MTIPENFQLDTLLTHLDYLWPERLLTVPTDALEWILSEFVISAGQQLHVAQEKRPTGPAFERASSFGQRYLPFSIADDYPTVGDSEIRILALASVCRMLHIAFLDWIVDEPATAPMDVKIAIQHCLLQEFRLLSLLFAHDSPLWGRVQAIMTTTSHAMAFEQWRHWHQVQPYSWDEFKEIALGKMDFAQLNTVAMALLSGTTQDIPVLQEWWQAISLAAIINDDVLDWEDDYTQENYTYLLSQVLLSPPFHAEVLAGQLPSVAEVGTALFYSDLVESMYDRVMRLLSTAKEAALDRGYAAHARLLGQTEKWMEARYHEIVTRKILMLVDVK